MITGFSEVRYEIYFASAATNAIRRNKKKNKSSNNNYRSCKAYKKQHPLKNSIYNHTLVIN